MSYNFGETKPATANVYLNPGIYKLKVTKVEEGKFPKGSPYIGVTFENEDEVSFTEKFGFGSDDATEVSMKRLQYLHESWFNKTCEKDFKSLGDIATYFNKALTGKVSVKTVIVGGKDNNGTVYASLPFSGFIVPADVEVELGEFDKDSKEWNKYVTKAKTSSESVGKKNGILNDDDNDREIGSNKKTEEKSSKKVKETAKEEESEMPW